ncbi:hypothetical protein HQ531_06250 [bacterium]|nr:hypothetical protein [bacterium]
MQIRLIIISTALILLISCTSEKQKIELSDPGFGVVETSIDAGSKVVNLPVLINTQEEIKGIQFTMTWDEEVAKVGKPHLTKLNSGFTVSTGAPARGQMKVLVFSMAGDVLNTLEPEILSIPITIIDPAAAEFSLIFENAIFAGSNAKSYEIPVSHANLKINS